jgi:DNA replication protein DnaC
MITLECNYSKKIGLPGYSSHQFSITLRTEIADVNQVQQESARLYQLQQNGVDSSIQEIGYAVVALDDIGYVQQDREEMEVLFTFLAERYERRSVMITSNLVFSKWDQIFKDPMTTMAAIDRLVHHATILEFDGESVRAKKTKARAAP